MNILHSNISKTDIAEIAILEYYILTFIKFYCGILYTQNEKFKKKDTH